MGIFDTDENGKRLTKKQKDRAKSWAGGITLFFFFTMYKELWREGNNLQKARMVISWVLCFVGAKIHEGEQPTLHNKWTPSMIILTIWLVFVIGSWYWRYKESQKSE